MACGRSSTAPTTPTPPTPTPTPAQVTITGHVTATNGGQPVSGLQADLSGVSATTDAAGGFRYQVAPSVSGRLALNDSGIVPRTLTIATTTTRDLNVDVFGAGFDLPFYRKFVRNGFEAPTALQPLRRLTAAPNVYTRTVDEAGQPVDSVTLNTTADAIAGVASLWTGGAFGVASIQRGTETRERQAGWLTVKWPNPVLADTCGRSSVGVDGGSMELNYLEPRCACNGSKTRPLTARHELGHAFGYWHTGDASDLMSGLSVSPCDMMPSAREQKYARYAYRRQVGNLTRMPIRMGQST
jgi:hypothetical protein